MAVGNITGGSLKTQDRADEDSLQANWFTADTARLPELVLLRAPDILPLINAGKEWYERGRPFSGLPVNVGHVSASIRLVLTYCTSGAEEGQVSVLVNGAAGSCSALPVCVCDMMTRNPIGESVKVCVYCTNTSAPSFCVVMVI